MSLQVKIDGVYRSWDYVHNQLGYTEYPTISMTFKSASPQTWGEFVGNGYWDNRLNVFWCETDSYWFTLDGLLGNPEVYPSKVANIYVKKGNIESPAVRWDEYEEPLYLIKADVSLGWLTYTEMVDAGWEESSGGELAYIIVDEDTGEIVFSQNDPGMEFAEVGTLLMPDSEMILVQEASLPLATFYLNPEGRDATENHTLSLVDNPVFDADGNNILYADYPDLQGNKPFCFMRVDNTFFMGGEGDSLINWSEGKAGIGALASRGKSAWSVSFEVQPSELTAYFTSAGAGSTSDSSVGRNSYYPLFDANGNRIPYDSTKVYVIVGVYQYDGTQVQTSSDDFLGGPDGTGLMWFSNVLPSTGTFYYAYKLTYTVTDNT